jgi:hypothetical protein
MHGIWPQLAPKQYRHYGQLKTKASSVEHSHRRSNAGLGPRRSRVRAELAKRIEKSTLTPSREHYIALGKLNFVARGSIGGAGGQNRTGYARLFRAALYQ